MLTTVVVSKDCGVTVRVATLGSSTTTGSGAGVGGFGTFGFTGAGVLTVVVVVVPTRRMVGRAVMVGL